MTRLAVALCAAIAMAACSPASGTASGAGAVETTDVDMPRSYRFSPEAIVVDAGDTVTWTNSDNFTHNVTIAEETAGQAEPGATITYRFDEPGTYEYLCSLHPSDMKGTVTVR